MLTRTDVLEHLSQADVSAGERPGRCDDGASRPRAVHAGQEPDPVTGAVVPPISLSTTFAQEGVGRHRGWEYARSANPTRAALEACIASLEGARHGLAFASGLAAEDAVLRQLPAGAGIVLGGDAYGGTFRLIDKVYGASGHPWAAADLTDPAAPRAPLARRHGAGVGRDPHQPGHGRGRHRRGGRGGPRPRRPAGGRQHLRHPVPAAAAGAWGPTSSSTRPPSTWAATRTWWAGAVALTTTTWPSRIGFTQNAVGAVPSPVDCYLVQRGIKTLPCAWTATATTPGPWSRC